MKSLAKRGALSFLAAISVCASGCMHIPEMARINSQIVIPKEFGKTSVMLNDANSALFDFPEEIPGARKVEKYLTLDAKLCLVHVLQSHYTHQITKEKEKEVKAVQKDIYQILEYLSQKSGIEQVYCEGTTLDIEDLTNSVAQESFRNKRLREELLSGIEMQIRELEKNQASEKIQLKKESLSYLKKINKEYDDFDDAQMVKGAAFILACNGKIKIKAAEFPETQANAVYKIRVTDSNSKTQDKKSFVLALLDEREDAALQIISQSEKPLAVVIYGGLHAFGGKYSFGREYDAKNRISLVDNIERWNHLNPGKKYSLIEITPANFD